MFRILFLVSFLFTIESALSSPSSPFVASFPDTLNGSNGYGAFSIIRTDTSFSGTVCDGQISVEGTWDADSVYLTRALLGTSDFYTHISYLPGDTVWGNATLLISSFCKNLIDVGIALQQQGTPFPSGEIELFESLLLGETDPVCNSPSTRPFRLEFFSASLDGDFLVEPACMAIINPGTVTNLTSTEVRDFGTLVSFSPPEITPPFQSYNLIVKGTIVLFGAVDADSVYLDGSIGRASLEALSLNTRSLDVESGDLSITQAITATKIGIAGLPPGLRVSANSVVGSGPIITPRIVSSNSVVTAIGLAQANELQITGGSFTSLDFDIPLVHMTGGTVGVSDTTLLDSLDMVSGASFGGGAFMSAKKIVGSNSSLSATLLQVKQGPATIDLVSSQINAGTLDADFMNLTACSVNFGTIVTKQTIADHSSFQGGLLNARTGRSLFFLNTGFVTASHINVGTYDVNDVVTTTPFMEGDTLLTLRGSIHDGPEDSLRIDFTHRSFIDSTLVYSGMIYASLAEAEVTQGSWFKSDRRGDDPRQDDIAFPGEVTRKSTGASYGGYGGTNGNMNVTVFIPADDPVGVPDFAVEDVRKGLGGFGWTVVQNSEGGVGGGRIRIDASSLVWRGYASVNGGNARQPVPLGYNGGGGGGGGTGGTIHVDVSGEFSGNGRIESNGGNGAYSFGGDLVFQTGSGGSGGRIRINYGTLGLWNGTVKTLGGLGGAFDTASISFYIDFISPWIDSLNNGGPGTIYWKQIGGNGRILVDGVGGPGGVGRVDGNYPLDTLEVHGAFAVTNGLQLAGLKLTGGGILHADNPRVRLRWPPPAAYGVSGLFPNPGGYMSSSASYPVRVWEDSLRERLTINVMHDVFVDGTSRLDLTGQGGYGQSDYDFVSGAYGNRAGGSYGGYGGWGRWASEHQMGKPNALYGDPLKPEDVGEGGYGVLNYVNTAHTVAVLGGAGGGALRLTAGGVVHVDGKIISDGGRGKEDTPPFDGQGTGGGSGGSVWITASSLAGSGMISASGGNGSFDSYYELWGGGGGGGRIRIDYGSKGLWSGEVRSFGGRGGQLDASHNGAAQWTNPRLHGGAGTIFWNESSLPTIEVRNFAADSGASSLSGTFAGIHLTVRNAMLGTRGLAVGSLALEDHGILTADDNRNTLYSFPGYFSTPNRFPFWTGKTERFVAIDAAGNVSIDATSRVDASGLGGFSREDFDALHGAAANPAGGSHGGIGGTGAVDALIGIASPAFGDSARPVTAGLGGFGDEALVPSGVFYDQCGAAGSGGAALRISVGGTLDLQGSIRSIGLSGTALNVCTPENGHAPSGGAGGSVFLAASQITGSGLIDASGGDGVFNPNPSPRWGGGGGGGRIAIYSVMTGFMGIIRADGGLGGAGNGVDSLLYQGQPGTIITGTGAPGAAVPFAVVGSSIAAGDTGVSRTDTFRIMLNKPARLSSLVFTLSPDPGGGGIRGNFAGDSLWLDHAPLAEQTTYTLRIVQLKSMFGDTLSAGSAREWIFSTGGTIISSVSNESLVPLELALTQNYPNPFNPSTTIDFTLPQDDHVSLRVYNLLGESIATLLDEVRRAGMVHRIVFDASRFPSGIYFIQLRHGQRQLIRKMVLLR
ncbi:MAG: T9SS type A sorting domain-containing protein [Bacteroidota bacterium]